jgi:GNAT superfamily N-acetyltransferase
MLGESLSQLPLVVMDEYTSVVSRAIARVASAALSRAIRSKQIPVRFVAVTCHEDVISWLRPDWVLRMQPGGAEEKSDPKSQISNLKSQTSVPKSQISNLTSESSDPSCDSFLGVVTWGRPERPKIDLDIRRVSRDPWPLFRRHHYLSGSLHPAAQCFAAYFENEPVAFCAALPFPHPRRPGWREHRLVCLPDFQGIGIGTKLGETVARMYVSTGRPYFSTTSHLGIIRHRANSPLWRIVRPPGMVSPVSRAEMKRTGMAQSCSIGRITASFEYVGPGEERIIHHGVTEARRPGSA